MNGSVVRTHRNKNYKTIGCAALDDKELSFRAKGIHAYLITRPDGWQFNKEQIMSMSTEGREAFKAGFEELKSKGYIKLTKTKQPDGTYIWHWDVYEDPNHDTGNHTTESRTMVNRTTDEPYTVNPKFGKPVHITSRIINNTDYKGVEDNNNKYINNKDKQEKIKLSSQEINEIMVELREIETDIGELNRIEDETLPEHRLWTEKEQQKFNEQYNRHRWRVNMLRQAGLTIPKEFDW